MFTNLIEAAIKLTLTLKPLAFISLTITPIFWLIEKITEWHVSNAVYATLVLFAIVADHVLGSIYHLFWAKDFSIKKNLSGFLLKILIVVLVGYLFEGLNHFTEAVPFFSYYTATTLRLLVFLYPASSAFKLSYEMTGRKFPPMGLMKTVIKYTNFKNETTK